MEIGFLEIWMSDMINLAVPYYCQRENTYVWYQKRKEDKYDKITNKKICSKGEIIPNQKGKSLAPITCNITSLCMILHYFGITQGALKIRKISNTILKQPLCVASR